MSRLPAQCFNLLHGRRVVLQTIDVPLSITMRGGVPCLDGGQQ